MLRLLGVSVSGRLCHYGCLEELWLWISIDGSAEATLNTIRVVDSSLPLSYYLECIGVFVFWMWSWV